MTNGKNRTNIIKKFRKEGDHTEDLTKALIEELNCKTVFTIPVFGGIAVDEGVVVTWIIMTVLALLSFCAKPQSGESGKSSACFRICDRVGRELFQRHHRGRKQTLHTLVNDSCTVSCMCESDRTFWI